MEAEMDPKNELTERLKTALKNLLAEEGVAGEPPEIVVEAPRNREHGDYATNVALQLARALNRNPMQIAEALLERFDGEGLVAEATVAKPGFINFRMAGEAAASILRRIAEEGPRFGRAQTGAGRRVLVEFVSANPTGPLHIGHARNAVVGDVLARLYAATGHEVVREYYFNDAGAQMDMLGNTLRLRVREQLGRPVEWPASEVDAETGEERGTYYKGGYMIDIAKAMIEELGPEEAGADHPTQFFTDCAVRPILKTFDDDLRAMGIPFDNWFREKSLYEDGKVTRAIENLRERGEIYEEGGATWFRATRWGDGRDRVVVKSNGAYTYLIGDVAYNEDKFSRNFDCLVNLLGADHHGQVASLIAAAEALGHPKEKLRYVIYQMVTLLRGGVTMKLSTRAGEFITLKEMIDELGVGVVRYFFAMRSPDAQMVFDWDLAKDTSMDNPVYYVQYAHARCRSLFRKAEEVGCPYLGVEKADLSLLAHPDEKAIVQALGRLPEVVHSAAADLAPQDLTNYLQEVAQLFHNFFTKGNNDPALRIIIPDQPALTQARLALTDALRTVLANALGILGIEPIERM
jgi:arginyl-tRNA synthetase